MSLNPIQLADAMRRHRWWDDEVKDAISTAKANPGARITTNTVQLTEDFTAAATLADFLGFTYQMKHRWALDSEVRFHIHWFQNNNVTPNWVVDYRTIVNGAAASGWTRAIWVANVFAYPGGTIMQYTTFAGITPVVGISGFIEFKLYRDTANVSGLFGGADPYPGSAALKEGDLHYQIDSLGSWAEQAKWGN